MNYRRRCFLSRAVAALLLLTSGGCHLTGAAETKHPLEYRHLTEAGPLSIHVVSFDLDSDEVALTATVGAGVNGSETISDMMKRMTAIGAKPLAAINGDYFEYKTEPRYQGTLQGITIAKNELLSGPAGTTFWIDEQRRPHLGTVTSNFRITFPDGKTLPFGLNCSPSDYKSEVRSADIVLYTPSFGTATSTTNVREVVLEQVPGKPWLPLRPNRNLSARVQDVGTKGNMPIGPNEMVLSVAAKADAGVPALKVGDVVTIATMLTPGQEQTQTAIAGAPLLIKDGKVVADLNGVVRHPRTAIGFAGSRCYFVVVDGRQPQLSIGVSHAELAAIMQRLGCTDALNLDGGGSSTLWLQGRVVNSPSDGAERPVGNGLVLLALPAATATQTPR